MGLTNREYVGRALERVAESLEPYIRERVGSLVPGIEWPKLLEHKDEAEGRPVHPQAASDLVAQIRVLTSRFGAPGHLFELDREQQRYVGELREVRNRWAHGGSFSDDDTQRVMDTCVRFMKSLALDAAADSIHKELMAFRQSLSDQEQQGEGAGKSASTAGGAEASNQAEPDLPAQPDQTIQLALSAVRTLSYAVAHNAQEIVHAVAIDNSGTLSGPATIRVTVEGAHGAVTIPWESFFDLHPGQTILRNLDVHADPAVMLQFTDVQPGVVRVVLEHDGRTIAGARQEIKLLGARHWILNGSPASMELLASFVQPNDPAIARLSSDATGVLRRRTGDGSMQGFQASIERADQIVEAIFTAMQERQIRYSEPPASWGSHAQRVRSPEEVLEGKLGTCMDTAVVLAAALEYAGINSTLWLTRSHAFVSRTRSIWGRSRSNCMTKGPSRSKFTPRYARLLITGSIPVGRDSWWRMANCSLPKWSWHGTQSQRAYRSGAATYQ